jgi:hypothetical protein
MRPGHQALSERHRFATGRSFELSGGIIRGFVEELMDWGRGGFSGSAGAGEALTGFV